MHARAPGARSQVFVIAAGLTPASERSRRQNCGRLVGKTAVLGRVDRSAGSCLGEHQPDKGAGKKHDDK